LKNKIGLILRISVGLLFIAASYYKILSPGAFAHQIYNYKLLPVWAINPLAITLPWLQLFCGLALIFNRGARGASLLAVLMILTFQAALASALLRGLNIACGCFKTGGEAATWKTFGRDFLFLVLTLWNAYAVKRSS
jgi:putative oxidoreductase